MVGLSGDVRLTATSFERVPRPLQQSFTELQDRNNVPVIDGTTHTHTFAFDNVAGDVSTDGKPSLTGSPEVTVLRMIQRVLVVRCCHLSVARLTTPLLTIALFSVVVFVSTVRCLAAYSRS